MHLVTVSPRRPSPPQVQYWWRTHLGLARPIQSRLRIQSSPNKRQGRSTTQHSISRRRRFCAPASYLLQSDLVLLGLFPASHKYAFEFSVFVALKTESLMPLPARSEDQNRCVVR
ncbi:hypothetical protein GALMADRAFT_220151 [Galerina marginata CBS 339.88]|uniref:Uncharacterized protein n=1 Tax=Galerina marginata (strain CBS 339.88) TaxID=685588 RepID=A0A067TZ82_GALM3|nr:hypothetical protein GALMADRAFT_220151 [Galerina marginata CBS 339.88]